MRKNSQRREVVFNFLKSRQHGLPVGSHGAVILRASFFGDSLASSLVKECLGQCWSNRKEAGRPDEPGRDRGAFKSSRRAQRECGKECRFGYADLRVGFGNPAFRGSDIRSALQELRWYAEGNWWRRGFHRFESKGKCRCRLARQHRDRMF